MTDKQDNRLLAPEEIEALPLGEQGEHRKPTIGSWWKGNCELFDVIKKAQDAKTLREVGERIYDMATGQETKASDQGNIWVRFSLRDWQALKQGKFPEGTKD